MYYFLFYSAFCSRKEMAGTRALTGCSAFVVQNRLLLLYSVYLFWNNYTYSYIFTATFRFLFLRSWMTIFADFFQSFFSGHVAQTGFTIWGLQKKHKAQQQWSTNEGKAKSDQKGGHTFHFDWYGPPHCKCFCFSNPLRFPVLLLG